MNITDDMVQAAFDALEETARDLPEAKAKRVYLEAASKSIKAKLMTESNQNAANAQERYAYSHKDYELHIEGLKEAVIQEERLRLYRDNAAIMIEAYRTQESTRRSLGRVG